MPSPSNVFIEFHALTSHAPSNLNRDELGTPKTALFGGARRLRISSQCLKRTWRTSPYFRGELAESMLGVRTSRLPSMVREDLAREGVATEVVDGLVALLQSIGRKEAKASSDEQQDADDEEASDAQEGERADEETAHLLFLSQQEIGEVKAFARANAEKLTGLFASSGGKKKGPRRPDPKKLETMRKALELHLGETCARNAVDVALFGRFVTSSEIRTVDAAMQVAHALGTQKVEVEYDFFSAVDDLSKEQGAGHIGESEFAASVFYKYAVCDLALLRANLAGDDALAARALGAMAAAVARAVPKGKANGTAPQNPADYLEVVVRQDAPISLANAFLKPVEPTRETDVMQVSIDRLRQHADRYDAAYGSEVLGRFILSTRDVHAPSAATTCDSLKALGGLVEELVLRASGAPALAKEPA